MSDLNFPDLETFNDYVQGESKGFKLVTHLNCKDYPGMVLCITIHFDTTKPTYGLGLEWMSLGLDLYGDILQESYMYQFENMEKLLEYLLAKYAIKVTDIPIKYSFDGSQFPNPIYHTEKSQPLKLGGSGFNRILKPVFF